MHVDKKELEKSQVKLTVELSEEEFKPYIEKGAEKISRDVKIEGFRPGKVPYDVLKQKIGEMTILEEAARIAVNKTLDVAIDKNIQGEVVGQPQIEITKIAPGNPMQYKITLALLPKIELGEYKNLGIKEKKTEVKDEEISRAINEIREMRAKEAKVEREIKEGDKAAADIQMFLDNVPIEGGQSRDAAIIIGKDYIVKGFDKQLLGAKKGETKEFSLPYPKDHHMHNLAGKNVDFKVTVKEVYNRELPEMNDEFARGFGLKNFAELKENIKKTMEQQKTKDGRLASEKAMLDKIVSKARFGDIPEVLVNQEAKTMLGELKQGIQQQGGKFEDYLASLNKTEDQLTLDLLPDALKRVKVSLLIREIGDKEKIKAGDEEVEKYMRELKEHHKDNEEAIKQINNLAYKNYVANVLTSRKIVDKLREWNIK